jgi:hypothetical protein
VDSITPLRGSWVTTAGIRLRRAPAHLQRRRFRIFNVGNPKTGTTTIPQMFAAYRSGHEWGAEAMLPVATAVLEGNLASDSLTARRGGRRSNATDKR